MSPNSNMNDNRITSRQNPRIKEAARLRDRRQREKQGRILIEGVREVERAVAAGVAIDEVFCCPELCQLDQLQPMFGEMRDSPPVWSVTPEVFEKIAFGQRNDGLVAIAPTPSASLAGLDSRLQQSPPTAGGLIAVLEGVEKPGNLGAILRSADGAGVSAVIVCDGATDLFNPGAIRASLGTIFTVPVAAASASETLAWLRGRGCAIAATRPAAEITYTQFDWTRPAAVVLGSEATGLSSIWTAPDIAAIRLPMLGAADSLNVSAAAAVIFYEALKQRE